MNDKNENNSTVTQLLAIRNELKGIAQKVDKLSNPNIKNETKQLFLGFNPFNLIIILIAANILTGILQILLVLTLINKPASYEYQVVSPSDTTFETEMDILGNQGWQIVSCRRASDRLTDSFGYECIIMRKND